MKIPLLLSLLLLALLVPPAGHGAHHRHRHHHLAAGRAARALRLLPPRVVRTPAVARQPRHVQAIITNNIN